VIENRDPNMKKAGEGRVVEKREGLTDLWDETVYKHGI
jgi:hypothetical protein